MPFKPFPKGNRLAKGGPRPDSGRKPLAVRALCANSFFDRISKLTGIIDAPDARPADRIAAMSQMIPLGRGGTPAEAAGAIYLFCSPDSDFVSGQTLVVTGGA